jgi:glycosyltransferase involved in cell wall biosynthesis
MLEHSPLATPASAPSYETPKHISLPNPKYNSYTLSIIIPCYNEAATISSILDKIAEVKLSNGVEKEIILVNDCSTDETDLIIRKYLSNQSKVRTIYIKHITNQGKGAAIHTGITKVTGDFLIIQDADLEYDPAEYNVLLGPILKGHADVVYGSRFLGGNPHRILFFWHTIGNRILTLLCNMFSNLNLTDMETGYKLFKTTAIQQIQLKEKRFGFEPEVTLKIARIPGIKIYEVGISYFGRSYEEGKKIQLKDAFRCIYCLLKYRFFSKHVALTSAPQVLKHSTVNAI